MLSFGHWGCLLAQTIILDLQHSDTFLGGRHVLSLGLGAHVNARVLFISMASLASPMFSPRFSIYFECLLCQSLNA